MKKFIYISTIFTLILVFASCSNEIIEDPINTVDMKSLFTKNNDKLTGFDEWGFNFTAHKFNSYLINAMLGDPAFEGMPHYRQPGLVYHGEGLIFWENLMVQYPYFAEMMPPGLLDCKLEMKWNEAAFSKDAVYPPTWNDTGAWFLFKYKMNTENEHWVHVRKFICISRGDELIDGIWYNSEGQEIGIKSYYWPDQLIIKQVINTGENPWVPWAMPNDYVCPNWVGFGNI